MKPLARTVCVAEATHRYLPQSVRLRVVGHEGITIAVQGSPALRITSQSGRVRIVAERRNDIQVDGGTVRAEVERDGVVAITSDRGSGAIEVRIPEGSCVAVGTSSGKIEGVGALGDVRATSRSGSVSIESARRADLRSESGAVHLGNCAEALRVQTTSGRVEVEQSALTEVSTGSGRVSVVRTVGTVRVRTCSGRVELTGSGHNDITVQTMSGGVTVKLPATAKPAARLRSLKGHERCDLEDGDDCLVAVESMQGAIEVVGMK